MKEKEILSRIQEKFSINALNEMQKSMLEQSSEATDMILLSPTGSGKTLAFIVPLLKALKEPGERVQAVVIAPSRELVLQIDGIVRAIATGYKVSCCYGGHNVIDEKQSLSVTPSIIVSTPGRLLDHINRKNIDISSTRILVLDEFDKSLDLGFHDDMKKIIRNMPNISRRFLTSATMIDEFPDFLKLNRPRIVNFLRQKRQLDQRLTTWKVESDSNDKLETALSLLNNIPNGRTILFANHRESVERIYDYLKSKGVPVGMYHGGLEQIDREKALTLFNNGTNMVLVTTDLGSRGLDIAEVKSIIHYHIPVTKETYIHRNGRTARIDAEGDIYIILSSTESIPEYMVFDKVKELSHKGENRLQSEVQSLYFQAGKKEKISRGDIVGFIAHNGGIEASEIGQIDLKDHYALVAVPRNKAADIVNRLSKEKIKNKKVRISIVQN